MHDLPEFVLERARAEEPVFNADEVAAWPDGLLDQLVGDGALKATSNAVSVTCDACGHDHVETVEYIESPPGTELRAYILCPENGRVRVPLSRLRRWIVNRKKLSIPEESEAAKNGGFQLPDNVTIKTTSGTEFLPTPSANDPKGLQDAAEYCRAQAARLGDARAKWWWTQARIYDDAAAKAEPRMPATGQGSASTPKMGGKSKGEAVKKRSWTQPDLDEAIRKYKAKRASRYSDLIDGVKRGQRGAKKAAREIFGRNVIVRALGVKSGAMVTNSPAWQEIADELGLRERAGKSRRVPTQRIGMEIALEEQAVAIGESAADQVVRRETIALVEKSMSKAEAAATIEKLQRGEITDDQARELVEVFADQKQDDRTPKIRQEP